MVLISPSRRDRKWMAKDPKAAAKKIQEELAAELGEGPIRFGPVVPDLSVRDQLLVTSPAEVHAFASLSADWEISGYDKKNKFTDEQMLRALIFCKYNHKRAFSLLKRMNPRLFELTAMDQEEQLRSKTLFPVPGLKTLEGSPVFYMRPSRYDPRETSSSTIIDNLVYVMDTYARMDPGLEIGMGFVANMNGWTMENFSTNYCLKFMQALQGHSFPAKVNLFLIVDPPRWFGKVWSIMKGMLSSKFQRKVHMITQDELGFFLKPGYEQHLPDEFYEGECSVDNLVDDFITFQVAMEQATGHASANSKKKGRGLLGRLATSGSASPPLPLMKSVSSTKKDKRNFLQRFRKSSRSTSQHIETTNGDAEVDAHTSDHTVDPSEASK